MAVEYAVCFANAQGGVDRLRRGRRIRGRAAAIHGARGYDLDVWRRGIFDSTRPNLTVEVEELAVAEGTGRCSWFASSRRETPPYGTVHGLFKQRVGKNCMPMDAHAFARSRVSMGAIDWSGEPAEGVTRADLDPVEIARATECAATLSSRVGVAEGAMTIAACRPRSDTPGTRHTSGVCSSSGTSGRSNDLVRSIRCITCYQTSETQVSVETIRSAAGCCRSSSGVEQAFTGPANPEQEVSVGLFKLRIPAFPVEVVREAVLNAVTHRDYSDPGEVLIRHTTRELVITSPGGFLDGITPQNILRHEPVARNRTLAEASRSSGWSNEQAWDGGGSSSRSWSMGSESRVTRAAERDVILRYSTGRSTNGWRMLVSEVARRRPRDRPRRARSFCYLREHAFIDTIGAIGAAPGYRAKTHAAILDRFAQPRAGMLERRGKTRAATYHLTQGRREELLGQGRLHEAQGHRTRSDIARWYREFVEDHGSITPQECRELLGLGESTTAKVETSRY